MMRLSSKFSFSNKYNEFSYIFSVNKSEIELSRANLIDVNNCLKNCG